jgi:hypothetical protein
MIKTLSKYDVTPNKTFHPIHIEKINTPHIHHLIRGIFDGDGCISLRPNKRGAQFSISNGHPQILEDIAERLPTDLIRLEGPYSNCYRLSCRNTKAILHLREYLYRDSTFYLSRKKDLFDELFVNTELTKSSKEDLVV